MGLHDISWFRTTGAEAQFSKRGQLEENLVPARQPKTSKALK
jgi:hypothetical protein